MSKSNNEPLKAALPLGILATTNASLPWLTARSSGVIRPLCLLVRKMDVSLEAQTKSLATLSAFSYIPPRRNEPKEMSYFNTKSKVSNVFTYDRVFHQEEGFDIKRRRDDRKHWKGMGLNINQEEMSRPVPLLSSSEYGRRFSPTLNQTARQYARVASTKSEFYMKNGIIWSVAEGYGSVGPT
ncbi:uncharacterized protein C5orf49 homolog [Girardinichthys multiradiatus]|uniref:uncharacterized protein C5orf49 homolog n=1 Tax=Girardinichthys multiradiatus TaxID=208333 RepID=UPI001FAC2CDA|nr:uncharacterized protein C5orf49 homolog [Girardinichthys multiradiatus]